MHNDDRKALGDGDGYYDKPGTYSPPENTRPKAAKATQAHTGDLYNGKAFYKGLDETEGEVDGW